MLHIAAKCTCSVCNHPCAASQVRDFSFNPDTGVLDNIKYDRFGRPLVPDSVVSVFSVSVADVTRVDFYRHGPCPSYSNNTLALPLFVIHMSDTRLYCPACGYPCRNLQAISGNTQRALCDMAGSRWPASTRSVQETYGLLERASEALSKMGVCSNSSTWLRGMPHGLLRQHNSCTRHCACIPLNFWLHMQSEQEGTIAASPEYREWDEKYGEAWRKYNGRVSIYQPYCM